MAPAPCGGSRSWIIQSLVAGADHLLGDRPNQVHLGLQVGPVTAYGGEERG
jgi:hypothetical protein